MGENTKLLAVPFEELKRGTYDRLRRTWLDAVTQQLPCVKCDVPVSEVEASGLGVDGFSCSNVPFPLKCPACATPLRLHCTPQRPETARWEIASEEAK